VGYELVKILQLFGLQPRSINSRLKDWSPDLFDVFTYLDSTTKNSLTEQQQKNASRVIDVLFTKTIHSGHFSKIHLAGVNKFCSITHFRLSLIILTWVRQLQQYFLSPTNINKDWNEYGKYCAVASNPFAKTTPLMNIYFSKAMKPDDKTQITSVNQIKPTEGNSGVCTSLEEWAFSILKKNEIVDDGSKINKETEDRWNRAEKHTTPFKITDHDFTKKTDVSNDPEKNLDLNTNASRLENIDHDELMLNICDTLTDLIVQSNAKLTRAKKTSDKELNHIRNLYDAASSFTVLMNSFSGLGPFQNLEEIKKFLQERVDEKNNPGRNSDDDDDDSDDDDKYVYESDKDDDEKEIIHSGSKRKIFQLASSSSDNDSE